MTTTAHPIPALEVSAPEDNMDVLSDTGFDFGDGDGDIDLDLDTAPSVYDDDMSLNDAATDGGLEVQELPADQDDFMADHGDLIEEDDDDDVYNNNDANAAPSHTVDDDPVTFEADMLAPPDEDLIDYSDDEAQQPVKMQSPSVHEEEQAQVSYEGETIAATADIPHEDVHIEEEEQPLSPTEASHDGVQVHHDDPVESHIQHEPSPFASLENQAQGEVEPYLDGDNDEGHVHVDDGGVLLPVEENPHYNDDTALEQQEEAQQNVVDVEESDHHADQQIELRPVTVNYAGNELWLFKQHDLDKSGDYLLNDISVAKSSMSDLFQACRASLGDDITGEQEIGFRLDHLHNAELYEDNTACVAVSLEHLVDLYYTLQAQDDNPDPECFYITLLFRPRFATLLADVARYAEQGSGYSAFCVAVVAGKTHFSSASTEFDHIKWDDEENDEENDEGASSPGSNHSSTLQQVRNGESDEPQFEDVEEHEEGQEEKSSQDCTMPQQGVDLMGELQQTPDAQNEESHTVQESADVDTSESANAHPPTEQAPETQEPESETVAGRQAFESRDERTPDQIAHDNQEAEDFVDYSDDEDDCEVKAVSAHETSPSSSTVQGDEPTEIQESAVVSELDRQDDEDVVEAGFDEHEDDTTLLTQTQYGDDVNHYAFQDYEETYSQEDPFQDFQADGTVGDELEANDTFNGNTNQDFTDENFQNLEDQANLDFDEQPLDEASGGDHFDETFAAVDDVTDAGGFLDLDNAPEWAVDTDPASNLPGEDTIILHDDATTQEGEDGGTVDQPVATLSSDADLALASSNDHEQSSPQGQKRSIDEVDNETNDAPDLTGTAFMSSHKRISILTFPRQTPKDLECDAHYSKSLELSFEY